MRLRLMLVSLLAAFLAACSPAPQHDYGGDIDAAHWQTFKRNFIHEDGRVVDVGNGNISHSEGQGYGMLLAVAANDRVTFDRLWTWTRTSLRRPDDALFAWRWQPDQAQPVSDMNNASDGELLIAWALSRAATRWSAASYRDEARTLARTLRDKLTRPTPHGLVLLPGIQGFEHPAGTTVNLAYWIFPAFRELEHIDPSPAWRELRSSGEHLLRHARFGTPQLPPDWLLIAPDGRLQPAPSHPVRFGFDALRIPLYACWGKVELPEFYAAVAAQWDSPNAPAWVDLDRGERAPYPLTPGTQAIHTLMQQCLSPPANPPITIDMPADNYYASVLILLSQLASQERAQ